jgi:hypothetical protein
LGGEGKEDSKTRPPSVKEVGEWKEKRKKKKEKRKRKL